MKKQDRREVRVITGVGIAPPDRKQGKNYLSCRRQSFFSNVAQFVPPVEDLFFFAHVNLNAGLNLLYIYAVGERAQHTVVVVV